MLIDGIPGRPQVGSPMGAKQRRTGLSAVAGSVLLAVLLIPLLVYEKLQRRHLETQ